MKTPNADPENVKRLQAMLPRFEDFLERQSPFAEDILEAIFAHLLLKLMGSGWSKHDLRCLLETALLLRPSDRAND